LNKNFYTVPKGGGLASCFASPNKDYFLQYFKIITDKKKQIYFNRGKNEESC